MNQHWAKAQYATSDPLPAIQRGWLFHQQIDHEYAGLKLVAEHPDLGLKASYYPHADICIFPRGFYSVLDLNLNSCIHSNLLAPQITCFCHFYAILIAVTKMAYEHLVSKDAKLPSQLP